MLAVCAGAGYAAYVYITPILHGTGCQAQTRAGSVRLSPEQAANAATIVTVGQRMGLPRKATTVALAAAFQESKLRNLDYGDRDSLGLFQQRPSQGWGKPSQLLDPEYAATQFYEALTEIKGYTDMPIDEAAQEVQRSANGEAYEQHTAKAKILSTVLAGRKPAGLHCWFQEGVGAFDRGAARDQLAHQLALKPGDVRLTEDGFDVAVSGAREGWRTALIAVANSDRLGIEAVSYHDKRWTVKDGWDGWQSADTPAGVVRIRGNTP